MWIYLPISVSSAASADSTLPAMIEHSFRPDQQTETLGEKSSQTAPTSRRRLNTKFVAWLMGLPEGWTSPAPINSEHWEMQSSLYLRRLLSSYCSKERGNDGNHR